MTENEIAKMIVDAAYHIHVKLGPGLLESAYESVLAYELKKRGLSVVRQQPIPVVYDEPRRSPPPMPKLFFFSSLRLRVFACPKMHLTQSRKVAKFYRH